MAASSALSSLLQTLNDILDSKHTISLDREKFRSVRVSVEALKSSFEVIPVNTDTKDLEQKILYVASRAGDLITATMFQDSNPDVDVNSWTLLNELQGQFGFFLESEDIVVFHQSYETGFESDETRVFSDSDETDDQDTTIGENVVIGLEHDLKQITERLIYGSHMVEVVPIGGMGGIGKTTLATQVYNDAHIRRRFDICARATASQEYCERQVLLDLLDSTKLSIKNMQRDDYYEKLGEHLYQSLVSRRYLIIIDDVWDQEILDRVIKFLPNNENGSRILFTTRLSNIASYPNCYGPLHQMNLLGKQESRLLLHNSVFGKEECPLELRGIQDEIVRKCKGLPLALVLIGGLLSKVARTKESWRRFLLGLGSNFDNVYDVCMKILALSYKNLPDHLKPCFLYMGMFPEDYTIPAAKLVHLWAAEGFLESNTSGDSENLAREYLEDLVGRNLISVKTRCSQDKIKMCKIHDVLWKLCQREAQKDKFLFAIRREFDACEEDVQSYLRLSICPNVLKLRPDIVYGERHRTSRACSLLCIGTNLDYPKMCTDYSEWDAQPKGLHYTLLRVLDLLTIHLHYFPLEISNLASLRYLALSFTGKLPPDISELQNLEMIVHKDPFSSEESFLPVEIWMMPNLRHLLVPATCVPRPPDEGNYFALETLLGVINMSFGICFVQKIRSLKKLAISYFDHGWHKYELQNLAELNQLQKLKFQVVDNSSVSWASSPENLAFPQSLNKLTLSGCKIPWERLTIVGALPNLGVLKLRHNACQGGEWRPNENQFLELKWLELDDLDLVQWRGDSTHFPRLKRLIIKLCNGLLEIPSEIGDIDTLERIELVRCHPRIVTSAEKIRMEQDYYGNSNLQVCVYNA